jgi:hypothetical protein
MLLAEEFTHIGRLLSRETPRGVIEDSSTAGLSRFQSEARISVGD